MSSTQVHDDTQDSRMTTSSANRTFSEQLNKNMSFSKFKARRQISGLSWVTFFFLALTFVVTLTAFISPGWGRTVEIRGITDTGFEGKMEGYYGMWYACWTLIDENGDHIDDTRTDCELILDLRGVPGWYNGCQVLAVFSIVCALASTVAMATYICARSLNRNITIVKASIIISFAGALIAVGLFVVWAVMFLNTARWCCPTAGGTVQVAEWNLYYGFVLGCIAPGIHFVCAVLGVLEHRKVTKKDRKAKYQQSVAQTRRMYYAPPVMPQHHGGHLGGRPGYVKDDYYAGAHPGYDQSYGNQGYSNKMPIVEESLT